LVIFGELDLAWLSPSQMLEAPRFSNQFDSFRYYCTLMMILRGKSSRRRRLAYFAQEDAGLHRFARPARARKPQEADWQGETEDG
jgi:hypothetical protein